MVNLAVPSAWTERCFIAIASAGQTTDTEYRGITNKISIERGEKGMESEALLNGGRVVKFTPETDTTVSMTITPVNVELASSLSQQYNDNRQSGIFDITEPIVSTNRPSRQKYRVTILWTEDPSVTSAITQPAATYPAYRMQLTNAYMTKHSPGEYTPDGYLSYEVEFKIPAFTKAAAGNITEESTYGTTQLAAISTWSG